MTSRRLRRVLAATAAGACALAASGCGSTLSDAATVTYRDSRGKHTVHIEKGTLERELKALVGSDRFRQFLTEQKFSFVGDGKTSASSIVTAIVLRQFITNIPIDDEFATLHLQVTPAVRAKAENTQHQVFGLANEYSQSAQGQQFIGEGVVFRSFPTSERDALIGRQARSDAVSAYYSQPTAEKAAVFFDEYRADLCPSQRVLSHILVRDEAAARLVVDQLHRGASFVSLASKSLDKNTAKTGGNLGCLTRGTVGKEVEAAAFAAPFDTLVGPVKSSSGYEVIVVSHPSAANLQAQIGQAMQQGLWLDVRLRAMKVWINPRFGTSHLVNSQQGGLQLVVTPPSVPQPRDQREPVPVTTTTIPSPAGG